MNVYIIPDQHGERNWEKVYNVEADYYVSLGDWFDSFIIPHSEQLTVFNEYIEWVKLDPSHRLSCIGNHDLAYLMDVSEGEFVSGHNNWYHEQIHNALLTNIKYFKPYCVIDDIVFSHAGFTKSWINRFNIDMDDLWSNWQNYYNKLKFVEPVNVDEIVNSSPTGDNLYQSPLWIRPYSLLKDSYYKYQIVGHTEMCRSKPLYLEYNNKKVMFCDSQKHKLLTMINTAEFKHATLFNKLDNNSIFELMTD